MCGYTVVPEDGRTCFSFSASSQEIGLKEHLRNDLFFVGWDIKP